MILGVACALLGAPVAVADPLQSRLADLQQEMDSLTEEIEDLQEPIAEFALFDQCAFTLGARSHPGFVFGTAGRRRSALSFDLLAAAPRYEFLAFPAEEPPGIECNEDAGPEPVDE